LKKFLFTAFCVLALCSLLLINVETVKAAEGSGYTRLDWPTQVPPTIDGQWTPANEWTDTDWTMIGEDAACGSTWDMLDNVHTRWFIEVFNDTTDDAGDYFEMCIDYDNAGGSAPGATHYRIYIENGIFTLFQGTGSGWTEITPSNNPADVTFATTLSTSPNGTLVHRIYEMNILKNAGTNLASITWGVRVAVYDASDGTLLVWPPDSERDIPNEWGTNSYEPEIPWVPEGFDIGIVVLLSSVAVLLGLYFLRKTPKSKVIAYTRQETNYRYRT